MGNGLGRQCRPPHFLPRLMIAFRHGRNYLPPDVVRGSLGAPATDFHRLEFSSRRPIDGRSELTSCHFFEALGCARQFEFAEADASRTKIWLASGAREAAVTSRAPGRPIATKMSL